MLTWRFLKDLKQKLANSQKNKTFIKYTFWEYRKVLPFFVSHKKTTP